MPIDRLCRYVSRVLGAAGIRMLLRVLAIPWLRYRGLLGTPHTVHIAFEVAIVADQNHVYKVALGRKSTIALEYKNCNLARRMWPQLASILPELEVYNGMFASCLSMNRYRPVGAQDSVRHAAAVYRLMQTCRTPGAQPIHIEDSAELASGIEVVANLYGDSASQVVRKHIQSYLATADYHVGFAHGDFHSRNVLLDDHGAPKLVDLDCVRFKGIQELDALYFVLELEWSRSGKLWYWTIVDFLRGTESSQYQDILDEFDVRSSFAFEVTYLVDRIGQETSKFGLRYTRRILDPAVAAICAV